MKKHEIEAEIAQIKALGILEALTAWKDCSDKNLRVNLEFYADHLIHEHKNKIASKND